MKISLSAKTLFVLIASMMGLYGCSEDPSLKCSQSVESASFKVNSTRFDHLNEIAWLRSGKQHSLQFMQMMPNGDQHVVIVVFNGDTVGNYPLLGINTPHRGSYFAPGINGTTFPDTIEPGLLTITDLELECLSGHYAFSVDTLEISGEFQGLSPE